MSIRLAVSATEAETARLTANGPRRDFLELAAATGGELRYRGEAPRRKGILGKLLGPHLRQAWALAGETQRGDVLFADGEHVGLPLLVALALRHKRPARVVMIGHLVSRRWKLPLFALATRLGTTGTVLLHSVEQDRRLRRWLGANWGIALVPYQADTAFWTPGEAPAAEGAQPLILAVGSENRDYETLVRAVEGLDARVLVAAGSHWARELATAAALPANVEHLSRPVDFAGLRELYRQAACVVVPLHDVANQSGVTVMLEAMACGVPVVVTATRGQREVTRGPLVRAAGAWDAAATADRGPGVLIPEAADCGESGLYVLPGDVRGLRRALEAVLGDADLRGRLGAEGRRTVARWFTTERYVANLAELLTLAPGERAGGARSEAA
ncbi:MAG: glycosyltransferase family 4 protein [Dehalococcoidia bacterium]